MKKEMQSSTAVSVMEGMMLCSSDDRVSHLISEESAEVTSKALHCLQKGKDQFHSVQRPAGRWLFRLKELLLLPGISYNYVLRKRYIEDRIVEAINSGARQIVNVGCGFDTLMYRLSKQYKQVTFYEMDHPNTLSIKRKLIDGMGSEPNLILQSVNLDEESLASSLISTGRFMPHDQSAFIFEGVLMYLSPVAIELLFQNLQALDPEKQMSLIATCAEDMSKHARSAGIVFRMYLAIKGEPTRWVEERQSIRAFLDRHNFDLQDLQSMGDLADAYVSPRARPNNSEYVIAACAQQQSFVPSDHVDFKRVV